MVIRYELYKSEKIKNFNIYKSILVIYDINVNVYLLIIKILYYIIIFNILLNENVYLYIMKIFIYIFIIYLIILIYVYRLKYFLLITKVQKY